MKYTIVPLLIYTTSFSSFFIVKEQYYHASFSIGLIFLIIIFYCYFNTDNIFDVYSLHEMVKEYEHPGSEITEEEISKWLQVYRHPLVVRNKENYVSIENKKTIKVNNNSRVNTQKSH